MCLTACCRRCEAETHFIASPSTRRGGASRESSLATRAFGCGLAAGGMKWNGAARTSCARSSRLCASVSGQPALATTDNLRRSQLPTLVRWLHPATLVKNSNSSRRDAAVPSADGGGEPTVVSPLPAWGVMYNGFTHHHHLLYVSTYFTLRTQTSNCSVHPSWDSPSRSGSPSLWTSPRAS